MSSEQPRGLEKRQTALQRAFVDAHYMVCTPAGQIALRVNHYNGHIAALHAQHRCTSSALLTACNPNAEVASPHDNQRAQAHLLRCIEDLGLAWYEGKNSDAAGGWPEKSVLAMGMSLDDARRLAAQFGQRGFLFCGENAIPALIMT